MKQILLIGLGGFFGSIVRYLIIGLWTQNWMGNFPVGTILTNLGGSLLIGLIVGLSIKSNQPLYWLTAIGFCGGFTTFSTFALDGIKLIKNDMWMTFFGYTSVSLIGGLALCLLGIWIGNKFV